MALQHYEYLVVSPGSRDYQVYLALRHAVFCEELKRVAPSSELAGGVAVETDEFDVHSLHILCRARDTKLPLGCARLILPSPKGLNVSVRYSLQSLRHVSLSGVGEIGRLAVSPTLRRPRTDCIPSLRDNGEEGAGARAAGTRCQREAELVALGLYREIFRLMGQYGVSHCLAAMVPALARRYRRLGFLFTPAGPVCNDVFPARQPYLIDLRFARAVLAAHDARLYQFMTGGDAMCRLRSRGLGYDLRPALSSFLPAISGGLSP